MESKDNNLGTRIKLIGKSIRHFHKQIIEETSQLKLLKISEKKIPIYKILNEDGRVSPSAHDKKLDKNTLIKMYQDMIKLNIMDKILYDSQRQGRISFYMTNNGEEACQIGSAAAFDQHDMIYAQYREAGNCMFLCSSDNHP
ncbi:unnamed protein product [Gordionus sp. m RMFG-2023]